MASEQPVSPPKTSSTEPTNNGSASLPRGLVDRRGNPSARGARLPSMRSPRDLTLGGATKKTFVPNLPARRVKKDDSVPPKPSARRGDEREIGRGDRGRGRGRGRGRSEIIQSHSIFEEGPAPQKQTTARIGVQHLGGGDGSGGSRASSGRRTVVKTEPESEDTRDILKNLLRDDLVDYGDVEPGLQPIRLPLSLMNEEDYQRKLELLKVKEEPEAGGGVRVKVEREDDAPKVPPTRVVTPPHRVVTPPPHRVTIQDIFAKAERGEEQLVFFQIPDVLPVQNLGTEDETLDKDDPKMRKCLANIPERKLGKIQVLKSGRVRWVMGDNVLNVEMGTQPSFLQELVSVKMPETNEQSTGAGAMGDMYALGQVKHRLVCTPDIVGMIEAKKLEEARAEKAKKLEESRAKELEEKEASAKRLEEMKARRAKKSGDGK